MFLIAKGFGRLIARQTKPRFEAAGRVVHPGMDHAAVMPGLVAGWRGLFFQQCDARIRVDINKLHSGRHADNAAADNHKIIHPRNSFAVALIGEFDNGWRRRRSNRAGASVRDASQDAA